jgi:hypothetical protein
MTQIASREISSTSVAFMDLGLWNALPNVRSACG